MKRLILFLLLAYQVALGQTKIGDGVLKSSVVGTEKIPVSGTGHPVISGNRLHTYHKSRFDSIYIAITSPKFTLGSDATGDIFYRKSNGFIGRLGVGSNGQVLTLAAGLPSWAAASGGGWATTTATTTLAGTPTIAGSFIVGAAGGTPNAILQISNRATATYPAGDVGILVSRDLTDVGHSFASTDQLTGLDKAIAVFDNRASMSNSNNKDHGIGYQSRWTISGSGSTINYIADLWTENTLTDATVTSWYGAQINNVTLAGTGAIGTQYGINIANLTSGTTNYSLKTGTAQNYFGGRTIEGQNGSNATNNGSQGSSYDLSFQQSLWDGAAETKGFFSFRSEPSGHSQALNRTFKLYTSTGTAPGFTVPIFTMEPYDAQDDFGYYILGKASTNNQFKLNVFTGTSSLGFQNSGAAFQGGFTYVGSTGVLTVTNPGGGGIVVANGISFPYVAKTGAYSLTVNDYLVEITSGTHSQTLPTAVGITGRTYVITNSGAGTVTVATTSSQTFANVVATPTTLTLTTLQTVTVISNGANWLRISTL